MAAYCFNPGCLVPENTNADTFCHSCGAILQLQGRYHTVQLLGGRFGRTFLAIDSAQTPPSPCVIKQFWSHTNLQSDRAEAFCLEQRLGELGSHSQIPALLDSFEEGHFYLVQEYIAGENLATILATNGRFSAAAVWQILECLLPVLQFIHERGVIQP